MNVQLLLRPGTKCAPLLAEARALAVPVVVEAEMADAVANAVAAGAERVVVAGGDGTVHHAARALLQRPPDGRPPLGIVPLGTANDLATAIGLPRDPVQALHAALEAEPLWVDVGRCNGEAFVNGLSAGLGAVATRKASPDLKSALGAVAYLLRGLAELGNLQVHRSRITAGSATQRVDLALLSICNSGRIGGTDLVPAASLEDGALDLFAVVDIDPAEPGSLLAALQEFASGEAAAAKHLWRYRAARFRIEPLGVPFETINLDGEPYRFEGTLTVDVWPKALPLLRV